MSSIQCAVCERNSRGLCDCCKAYLCLQHLNEHNQLLVLQLNPLLDEIYRFENRFNELLFNSQNLIHPDIGQIMFTKTEEQKESIINIEMKLTQLIHNQETTQDDIEKLQSTIANLQQNISQIERIYFQTITNQLTIDEIMIQLKSLSIKEIHPSIFSHVYKTLKPPEHSYRSLASNDQFLLIHQKPDLCLLDTELRIVKHVRWSFGVIHDIIWSPILKQFIIISTHVIYLLNPNNMSIQTLITNENEQYWSGTCFNDHLFVSMHSSASAIIEITLLPHVNIIRKWQSPVTCLANEFIDDIVCDNEVLCLIIRSGIEKSVRMELRSIRTLDRLWSIKLDILYNTTTTSAFHVCSFNSQGWLVADYSTGKLLQITSDGHLQQTIACIAKPSRICFFGGSNRLLMTTNTTLNMYKIST